MAIQDFGEKIGGAKKDLWKERGMIVSDLFEMNDAERESLIKKDNVWQKPDYAALQDEGLPIRVIYFIKCVRDSIGTKPVISYYENTPEAIREKQEKYIEFVGTIRDAVMNCKTEDDVLSLGNRTWLVENGYIKAGTSYYVDSTSIGRDVITNKFLKAFLVSSKTFWNYDREIKKKQFLFNDEQKILSKYEFMKYENATWEKDYTDRERLSIKKGGGIYYMYPTGKFLDKDAWQEGSYFVMDIRHNLVEHNFASLEAAKKFVIDKDSGKEVEKPKKKGKTRFVPKQLEHIQRDGDNVRHGRSIGGQDYLDTFEFKGGEFGNWMSEKDRQVSLNMGYEALYDLAKALKIDLKDISLGNSLSIAFGARGSGNALAHYEPLREVINLTKMRGAGSLAHEWGHALDDILGKRLGIKEFMTDASLMGKKDVPESLKKLVQTMRYFEANNEDVKEHREKAIDMYKEAVRRNINRFFPEDKLGKNANEYKNKLIQRLIDNAPNCSELYFNYIALGEGNIDIDALSEFRKEVLGRVIPKEERINIARYQYGLLQKLNSVDKPAILETEFYKNSKTFDKEFSKTDHGYWASVEEMFARAFACYVSDKIECRSDYLCGHSDMAVAILNNEAVCAFPTGEERIRINQCFDEFIQELKDMDLLHHKEDFVVEVQQERKERDWEEVGPPAGECYQMSFLDVLDNAYERSGNSGSKGRTDFDLDK